MILQDQTVAHDWPEMAAELSAIQAAPPGYRHLFGPPAPHQIYRIHGLDPLATRESQSAARQLMRRLSLRMEADMQWPGHASGIAKPWENPKIPSGYAYLFQFVGHDLVHTSVPFSAPFGREVALNARRSPLALETIYGIGPVACPIAYMPEGTRDDFRVKLRLGRIRRDDRTSDAGCPYRDIARSSGDQSASRSLRLTDPLLADPRNDDHAILSQLTALFALLHNGLIDRLDGSDASEPQPRYLAVRSFVTYLVRRIVRNDLLRRFLDPTVYRFYADGSRLEKKGAARPWAVPLEFSHGAIRFGHSLVRNEYRINDGALNDLVENLTKTSLSDAINMPLNESWIVQWSHFFSIDGSKPNLSKRIGPHYSGGLVSDRFFPAIDGTNRVGLAYRDLASSCLAGLWSVDALIQEIRRRCPELIDSTPLLASRESRTSRIAEWLAQSPFGRLDASDIEALSDDPPLPFFVLWEAAFEPGVEGLRLGRLGSIIVAETIFGALDGMGSSAGGRFPRQKITVEDDSLFKRMSEIDTMSELVLSVAELCDLSRASPAFV